MFVVGVYVTSRYKNYPELKVTLDEALKKYIPTGKPNALCTGSSKSNSAGNGLVKKYAFEHGIPCRVFETQWANNIPTKPGKKNTAGVRANAMIIRNSNACVLFWTPTAIAKWDFMSGGCYNFRKMCGKMRRELIEVKVDIYKPIDKDVEDERITTVPDREDVGGTEELEVGNDGFAVGAPPDVGGGGLSLAGLGGSGGRSGGGPSFGGSMPPPMAMGSGGDVQSNAEDAFDAVDASMSSSALAPSVSTPSTPSDISEIPVDVNGDGITDTSVTAMDTTGDGLPDAQLTPVDVDGNGTIDKIELTPLPQAAQTPQPATVPQQAEVDASATQSMTNAPTPQTADEEETQQSQ